MIPATNQKASMPALVSFANLDVATNAKPRTGNQSHVIAAGLALKCRADEDAAGPDVSTVKVTGVLPLPGEIEAGLNRHVACEGHREYWKVTVL
jgi:hypothetical protein